MCHICTPSFPSLGRRGDNYAQGSYKIVGVEGGKIRLQEAVGPRQLSVNLDRIDQRVVDHRAQVIGDDRPTLVARLAAQKDQILALGHAHESKMNELCARIKRLEDENKEKVNLQFCSVFAFTMPNHLL